MLAVCAPGHVPRPSPGGRAMSALLGPTSRRRSLLPLVRTAKPKPGRAAGSMPAALAPVHQPLVATTRSRSAWPAQPMREVPALATSCWWRRGHNKGRPMLQGHLKQHSASKARRTLEGHNPVAADAAGRHKLHLASAMPATIRPSSNFFVPTNKPREFKC